jgi:hypothetical protein
MNRPLFALTWFALAAAFATAQSVPSTLDEMIAVGLKSNPDVLLAEAKMRQAEAELLQARLKVTREIVELWNSKRKKEVGLNVIRTEVAEAQQLADKGVGSAAEVRKLRNTLDLAMAELSEFNVTIRPLLGIGLAPDGLGRGAARGGAPERQAPTRSQWPMVEDDPLAKATASFEFVDVPIAEAAKEVFSKSTVNLTVDRAMLEEFANMQVTLTLKNVTPRAAMSALADQAEVAFLLRDYGVLLTGLGRASGIDAPSIPEGLPLH